MEVSFFRQRQQLFQNRSGLASHLRNRVCKLVGIKELGAEDKCRKERDTKLEELKADRLHLDDNDIKGQTCILCNKVNKCQEVNRMPVCHHTNLKLD